MVVIQQIFNVQIIVTLLFETFAWLIYETMNIFKAKKVLIS